MKKRTLELALGALLAGVATAAAAETMTKPATGATRVVFSTPGELIVKPGSEEKVVIEAEAKVLPKLDVSMSGGTLTITSKGSFKTEKTLRYTVTLKTFRGLKADGSGNSLVEGFSGGDMEVEAGGSNNVEVKNVKADRLKLVITSAANIEASGSGKTVVARMVQLQQTKQQCTGNIDAVGFHAKSADTTLEGSGTIRVYADENLKAVLNGAGNIEYKGNAKVAKTINGAGSVDPI